MSRRKSFEGVGAIDCHLTKRLVSEFGKEDQALLRISLNGTFFTEEGLVPHR